MQVFYLVLFLKSATRIYKNLQFNSMNIIVWEKKQKRSLQRLIEMNFPIQCLSDVEANFLKRLSSSNWIKESLGNTLLPEDIT